MSSTRTRPNQKKANRFQRNGTEDNLINILKREELVFNISTSRKDFLKKYLSQKRDLNSECDYPESIEPQAYYNLFNRWAIPNRVVSVFPKEMWQVQPEVYELEDSETATEFEEAWDTLSQTVRGEESWYQDEHGSPIFEALKRIDVLSGIGQYGILLLGLDDGLPLNQPAKGVVEQNSIIREKDGPKPADFSNNLLPYSLTMNEELTKGRKLLYLRCFPEYLATVIQFEANPTSPRHGQPVMYRVTFNDPTEVHSQLGAPQSTADVHWTRVQHVADNCLVSNVWGTPRMMAVYNHCLDTCKLYGGSAEMYWQGAFPGIAFTTHPALGFDVDINKQSIRDQLEQWRNGLQRELIGNGLEIKTLAPTVVDPTPQLDATIQAICIQIAIPKRVFMGSERGELASSQDDIAWNDRLIERQNNYATPRLIVPFVDRLISLGVLPKPVGYSVFWPSLTSQSENEKADLAVKKSTALTTFVSGGGDSLMTPLDFFTKFLNMREEEATTILENTIKASEGGNDSPGSPLLGLVGGITGMLEMFQKFKDGAMSEETLRELIILFYKVDSERADKIIADGLPDPPTPELPAIPAMGKKPQVIPGKDVIAPPPKPKPAFNSDSFSTIQEEFNTLLGV